MSLHYSRGDCSKTAVKWKPRHCIHRARWHLDTQTMSRLGEADGRRIYNALPNDSVVNASESSNRSNETSITQQQQVLSDESPDENTLKGRSRKTLSRSKKMKSDELTGIVTSTKSPRSSSISKGLSNFFKSPNSTSRRKCSSKGNSELNHIKVKSSIRRRLTLTSLSLSSKKTQKRTFHPPDDE